MPLFSIEPHTRKALAAALTNDAWMVACLCAAWCDTCTQYRAIFERLAQRHPQVVFVWIDIEDDAELLDDIDIDNFPTLVIQYGDAIAFAGPVLPDFHIADRLLSTHMQKNEQELLMESQSTDEKRGWQQQYRLRHHLRQM